MSTFTGRRGPNVSQYLRDLNMQESMPVDDNMLISEDDYEKDLAMFTNTQFFDFETGQNTDFQAFPAKPDSETKPTNNTVEEVTSPDTFMGDLSNLDFLSGDFNFGDFSHPYQSPTVPTFPDHLGNLQPIQPNPQQAYHPPPVPPQQPGYGAPAPPSLVPGDKGKSVDLGPPGPGMNFEEQTRRLAEEDKRRRNTAASARFRIKKKQREQALEKSAKEMTDKVTALEGRISTLETENKWLRSLVMDKHIDGKDELAKLLSMDKEELSRLLKELKVKEGSEEKEDEDEDEDEAEEEIRAASSSTKSDTKAESSKSKSKK